MSPCELSHPPRFFLARNEPWHQRSSVSLQQFSTPCQHPTEAIKWPHNNGVACSLHVMGSWYHCPFPPISKGHKYLLVAIDYFTRWVEAKLVNSIAKQRIINFIFHNIIYHFGIPLQIIMDNGTHFIGKWLGKFCEDSGIKLSFAPMYHKQANGWVKVTNQTMDLRFVSVKMYN